MHKIEIIIILFDERVFPRGYNGTIKAYYETIIDYYHIPPLDTTGRKRIKRIIYTVLNEWEKNTKAMIPIGRAVAKYKVFNPRHRYNIATGNIETNDIYYRID